MPNVHLSKGRHNRLSKYYDSFLIVFDFRLRFESIRFKYHSEFKIDSVAIKFIAIQH
jgi:hypothetical protein